MNSFISKLIFKIENQTDNLYCQFDEQIRIIQANNIEGAFLKAKSLGKIEEESFLNSHQQTITWKFVNVVELFELQNFKDGDLLFSNSLEIENSTDFIQYMHYKSNTIQSKFLSLA